MLRLVKRLTDSAVTSDFEGADADQRQPFKLAIELACLLCGYARFQQIVLDLAQAFEQVLGQVGFTLLQVFDDHAVRDALELVDRGKHIACRDALVGVAFFSDVVVLSEFAQDNPPMASWAGRYAGLSVNGAAVRGGESGSVSDLR